MTYQFFTVGILMLLSAMLPGPDFAMVTKNTVMHSRRSGLFTTLGISVAILIHISYCALGLALIISNSIMLFNTIKYIGAAYLIYLGITTFLSKQEKHLVSSAEKLPRRGISNFTSFKQGFLCNLFNPKATMFFLALFTMVINPETPPLGMVMYAIEMFCICMAWFSSLTLLLSHPKVIGLLEKMEKYIAKLLGAFLVWFGIGLAFLSK